MERVKKQRHYFANKGPSGQDCGFSSGHVWMWELDSEESWAPKNWCFWTVVLEKALESPLDCKEIQSVHPKGDQSGVFIGRTDAEAETPILWPPHARSWLIGKDPDAGRDCGQEEKGAIEDEMAGWHHWLDGHEFEWTAVVDDGQGGLACCGSWSHKELDMTERLNWTTEEERGPLWFWYHTYGSGTETSAQCGPAELCWVQSEFWFLSWNQWAVTEDVKWSIMVNFAFQNHIETLHWSWASRTGNLCPDSQIICHLIHDDWIFQVDS